MAVTTSTPDVGATWHAITTGTPTVSRPDVGAIQQGTPGGGGTIVPVTPGPNIPLIGNYGQSKAGFGINQKIITIPEMNTFDEVRQVLARVIGELQNHIATQLPIIDYKQRKITNVAPPTEGDDVVTLKYLQSVQLPAQPKSS